MLGLYIHIPFCNSICTYCDFPKRISQNEAMKENYIITLMKELDSYKTSFDKINTLFIGGGTPNSLSIPLLSQLLCYLNSTINMKNIIEFSIELNPELIDETLVDLLIKYKINRVSLGVQTFNNSILKTINRKHTFEDILKAIHLLHQKGLKNINLDLMYNLPKQRIKDLKNDLKQLKKIRSYIKHISYYSLIVEEKSILYQTNKNYALLSDENKEIKMFKLIIKKLKSWGFEHYEISNFSKKAFESVHNTKYWCNEEYIGIGSGAAGYLNNIRYNNTKNVSLYISNFDAKKEEEILDKKSTLIYEMILGLRLLKGVHLNTINQKYDINLFNEFNLNKLISNGLLIVNNEFICLTDKGLFLANLVFEEFV